MCTRRTVETLRRTVPLVTFAVLSTLASSSCAGHERGASPGKLGIRTDTDELAATTVPMMLNAEPPFRYPVELWARKVQGNVTLRLHVDSVGRVRAESTSVVASSGHPALDSAAVRGSTLLTFAPAMRHGRPVGRSIRFPVHFRHPDASPFDTRDQHATPSRP